MPTITERDETAGATKDRYHYTRVVETAGHVVRVRIVRDYYAHQSLAVAEALADNLTWTRLAEDAPGNWWTTTPTPSVGTHAAAALGPIAQRLIHRAADILAPPPTTLPPHLADAVAALLATTHGYHGETRLNAEDLAWATSHGGPFRILTHHDGSVTFTKAHTPTCRFLTSNGTHTCDDQACS